MPYGLITWVDVTAQQAGVRKGNRTFPAKLSEVAPAARQVGARVHFDIARSDGLESATAVRLRSRNGNGRGGELSGARSAAAGAAAPATGRHPEYARGLPLHPLQVVAAWGLHLAMGELDEAVRLYSPNMVLHLDGTILPAGRQIRSVLETVPAFSCSVPPTVRGEGDVVVARWTDLEREFTVSSRVDHHLIAEQWVEPAGVGAGVGAGATSGVASAVPAAAVPAAAASPAAAEEVVVTLRGDVGPELVDYARQRIGRLIDRLVEPLLAAYVKLEMSPDPARFRPALAAVQLDLNGTFVGAHVAAEEMHQAVDLLQRRLADQLEHRERRFDALRHSTPARPEPGEWQHGDRPSVRPDFFDRPPEDRELVRHKVLLPEGQTVDEAVFDMEQLDYGFFLFRDQDSGSDSLVERTADGRYLLHRVDPEAPVGPGAYPVQLAEKPVPRLHLAEAVELLDAMEVSEARFVFYADASSGRGSVIYRRYDGHYGLITMED